MVCPGERPRLNQGLSRHHGSRVEGFEGPVRQVPQVMMRESGVPVPSTRLQHLGDSEVHLEQKRWSDTPDLPGPRRRARYARDIVFRSQKETVFLAISFLLHPAVTNNRSHCGQCAAVRSR